MFTRLGSVLRSLTASGALLVRRRARRDILLLLSWTMLLGFAVLLAVASPRLIDSTVDQGAREAVTNAGSSADLTVHAAVGQPNDFLPVIAPADILALQKTLPSRLPPSLKATYESSILTVLGPPAAVTGIDGAKPANNVTVQMAMLTPAQQKVITVVDGTLPTVVDPKSDFLDVVISVKTAEVASLKVGSVLDLPPAGIFRRLQTDPNAVHQLKIVAIVDRASGGSDAAAGAANSLWRDLPQLWNPAVSPSAGGESDVAMTVLAPPDALSLAGGLFAGSFNGTIRLRFDPSLFTGDLEGQVAAAVARLKVNSDTLSPQFSSAIGVQSDFPEALSTYPSLARAGIAQMSLMIAGLLGVAGVVIVLLSRLLILRRTTELALERARGSSLAGVGVRGIVESIVASVVGAALGLGAATLLITDVLRNPIPVALVIAVAVLAPPVQAMALARAAWSGRRVPANRAARLEIAGRARVRRLVIEGALIVLAGAALFSIRTRGLLQTRTVGIDPLLAAAPLLLGVAITVIVLRIYPWVVRGAASLGRRSRGALGVLGAAQAQRAMAVLPLLALTLAVGLAAGGGLLIDTVRSGQEDASWQRIGADARVDNTSVAAPIEAKDVAQVSAAARVTSAAAVRSSTQTSINGGTTSAIATVLAVDHGYASVVRELPADAGGSMATVKSLHALAAADLTDGRVPILVSRDLSSTLTTKDLLMRYEGENINVRVIGTVDAGPTGYLDGPFVYADLSTLNSQLKTPVPANLLLANGVGAGAAVSTLGLPKHDIQTRAGWLADRQNGPFVAGVTRVMTLSAIGVAILAIIALVSTVLAGSRARARSLALIRTLGMRPRFGWWLALAELAPVVVAALIGGTVAGIGMVLFLGPSLGLELLTGGLAPPASSISPAVILGIVGGAIALLGLAMLAEVFSHRRDRLSEVLRVGDS